MSCNYCPKTYMCQCPPKCVKCCKAATIYRSTLHVLHSVPQPQHSWPWEPRTLETNSGSWLVTNGSNGMHNLDVTSPDPFISKLVKSVRNGDQGQTSNSQLAGQPGWQTGNFAVQNSPPSLMSLTLTREKKKRRRNKTRKVKRKKEQNDLRLLLDEKNTQK